MRPFSLALLASLAATHAFAQSLAEDDYAAVVSRAVGDYIVPAYESLHAETGSLASTLQSFCADPASAGREDIAAVFAGTIAAWARVDFLRFGPMAVDGRYERFAFFPDVHGTGARQLRQFLAREDAALLEPGALAEQSAAVQGLPALESLLYSGEKALLNTETAEAFRCALAVAVAENLQSIASEAVEEWTGAENWQNLLERPGDGNPVYRTHKEALTEVLKAVLTGLEQMREHRLLPALGETPEDAKASNAPYNRSGQALPYFSASAQALNEFVAVSGLLDLAPEEQKWIANSIGFEFSNLDRAFADAGDDLEAALADPSRRQSLTYAAIVLASLRDLFQNRLLPAVGLTAGFNSLDGD